MPHSTPEKRKAYTERTRERARKRDRELYLRDKEKRLANAARWRIKSADKIQIYMHEYCRRPETKERERIRNNGPRRRAKRMQATPPWVNEAELKAIYLKCKIITDETGVRHHVDHIVPLKSDVVCGLHVPWNLQIITAIENAKKGNKLLEGV